LEIETEDRLLGTFAPFHLLGVVVGHDVHLCCLIAMGSVCGQFRFAGRFDPIEPKSFALIRKFRCGMSIQMANFQARDFDRNCVAVVRV
jgi:hypothetical protein